MDILYEDKYIIAVNKPAGLATQTKRLGEKDLFSYVKNYLKGGYVGIINRLDQPVSGVVLMAKNKQAAAGLEAQIADKSIKKHYRAEVYDKSGILKIIMEISRTELKALPKQRRKVPANGQFGESYLKQYQIAIL